MIRVKRLHMYIYLGGPNSHQTRPIFADFRVQCRYSLCTWHVSEGLVYQVLYRHVREVAGSRVQGLGFRRWDFGFKIEGHALVLIPQELLMSEYICCLLKP